MRVGMIGLDTSHVTEFAAVFRDHKGNSDLAEIQIVAGYPGGTDLPLSRDRVADFSSQLAQQGVEIVSSIPALLERVDAVMLESVDGSVHLQQAIPVIEAGKPLFIDKPIAASVAEAIEIERLARQSGVPCFSSSSLRFCPTLNRLKDESVVGKIRGAATWGPCHIQNHVPDLYFYGIHGIEALFTVMGRGCTSVQRTSLAGAELVVGTWHDGRIGTYRGIREGAAPFGATLFGTETVTTIDIDVDYRELCLEIATFFRTGVAPVSLDQTIEIFAFMDAADESKRRGGNVVRLIEMIPSPRETSGQS